MNLNWGGGGYTKSEVDTLLTGKADTSHTHTKSQITDFPSYGTTANTICEGNDSRLSDARTPTSHTHTKSEITDFPNLSTVATSGSYNDLSNKPTIPTKTSDLTNDSGFITEDNTKIPLAGSNAISGSLIPATTDAHDLGGSSYQWNNAYIKSLAINGVACGDILTHNASEFVPRSGGAVITGMILAKTTDNSHITLCGSTNLDNGAYVRAYGKDYPDSSRAGTILIRARDNSNVNFDFVLKSDGTAMWGNKNLAMQEDVVPRSGGAVISGENLARTIDTGALFLYGGTGWRKGGCISMKGQSNSIEPGLVEFYPSTSSIHKSMKLLPDGTWTWNGTAVQITSDQRLKQQIAEIDDKLLDAWEDVDLVQFKYNDAVDQKGKDKARLHTGYVVQQIDKACKSHNVDISDYGLYCHEEYPEETEEVEVEQADGTKTKETKVIREASEHYSLRYTEVYAVECMYLRREVSRLKQQNEDLEQRLKMLEQSVK